MDRIFIKDLSIRTILGVLDWERVTPQDILVNVEVFTDIRPASASDDIKDCLDYSDLVKELRALVEAARRFTVEALAEDIARLCLGKKGVTKVRVRVEKPKALAGIASVGVEIEREQG